MRPTLPLAAFAGMVTLAVLGVIMVVAINSANNKPEETKRSSPQVVRIEPPKTPSTQPPIQKEPPVVPQEPFLVRQEPPPERNAPPEQPPQPAKVLRGVPSLGPANEPSESSIGQVSDKLAVETIAYFDAKADYDGYGRLYLAHKLLREGVPERARERAREVVWMYPGTAAALQADDFLAGGGDLELPATPPRPIMPEEFKRLLAEIASIENQQWVLSQAAWKQYQQELAKGKNKRTLTAGQNEKINYAEQIRDLHTRVSYLNSTLNDATHADRVWVRSTRSSDGYFRMTNN